MAYALILILTLLTSQPLFAQAASTVRYTALSDAAKKSGQLARYDRVPVSKSSIKLGSYTLDLSVPKTARAYDVVPVRYKLSQPTGARRAAVEAIAFEDPAKAKGQPLYDLAIPGNMGVKIEYLGSVCADFQPDKYIPLTPDPKTPASPFPPFKTDKLVRTSTVRAANAAWFKFKITNTGDTILDPEGFGASFGYPTIAKIDKDGKQEWSNTTVNQYERHLNYLYPGESVEFWVNYYIPQNGGSACRGIKEGDYMVTFNMLYRYHAQYNWGTNIWHGADVAQLKFPIKVTKEGGDTPVETTFTLPDPYEKMPGYIDSFEEFMTAFRIYPGAAKQTEQDGVIYLQVAPWTKQVTAKLILTDPKEIAVARIPIKITDETLSVKYNPKNVMVVDGQPAIVAQAMPGMRTGFQLGPYPEEHMLKQAQEMKDLGVNLIANTSGNWHVGELIGRKGVELHTACYRYFYDTLARKLNFKLIGWSVYPPSGTSWYDCAAPLLGKKIDFSKADKGYNGADVSVDLGDPIVPEVIAAWTMYNYGRWGDMWFKTKDGRVPIDIEDTWGWMRDDINLRYNLGPIGLQRFRDWVKAKYGTIEKTNAAWKSSFKSFDEIDPQINQGEEGDNLTGKPVYNKKDNPFHDWSAAVNDWDTFRTELRMEIYKKANELIRKQIPGAELALRCEGANLVIKGNPKSSDMHWRHVYYSQRRNAMDFDVVKRENVLHFFSDYTTLPYTEAEWRQGMREMVKAGVIPVFLPQFDHMRDILLNPYYGREYQTHYNLDKPSKGMMIHCLMAAYPWWKSTYEEGGAPGIIWSDYACDGFATETQKRELKLLREHFDAMKK